MEKSLSHWKAEHPLLFISISIGVGYLIANYFGDHYPSLNYTIAFVIIGISMAALLCLPLLPLKKWQQGIIILFILVSWGCVIYLTTNKQNLMWFPYPNGIISDTRIWMMQKIDKHIIDKEASGFAKALLIGVKSDIDKNIIKAYTQLGIIHIIAISGMHLDIIFKNLVFVTSHLPRKMFWRFIELAIVLITVWIYTFIAFASPSVVRASIFFSLFFVGTFLNQPKYTLNCIAGGILVILFFDIHSIYHIGLQLSYAAVIGIHLFYPIFNKMLPMDNPILSWMWSNLCITLSAQLTTLPILLYHFHQTSTLVIISNFMMVPLSTLLLYALIGLVIMPNQVGFSLHLGGLIQSYINVLNRLVLYFHQNPIGTPLLIQMSGRMVVGYYFWLLFVYIWLYKRKAKYLFYSLVIITLISLIKLFP
jgi:competence protein ComEC